ncbi:signal peptidase I [Entomomonas sp. E2T0]|uniref:signal peptidase I n=1 Tax=Entomomonas sp. E2T0 TaxID=2930213 RepID=UPI0022281BCF|nr:signal peptidase I [Entomomonas sp. E2T0]UYZ85582.1 signal peptidase I [Entomomonas sp. E2T0]
MVFVVLVLVRYFNFTLILTLATFISLLVVVINRLFFVAKRKAAVKAYKESVTVPDEQLVKELSQGPAVFEFIRSLFPVLLIVFILRSFLVEPFQIPSGSMKPTLEVGDFILVNKFTYGIRFPVINKVIIPINKPQRGDVAVFHYPPNPEIDYIKRVIGVPGDHIKYTEDKRLYVNDKLVGENSAGKVTLVEEVQVYNQLLQTVESRKESVDYQLYEEQLGDVKHNIYKMANRANVSPKPNQEWVVPEGYYFMMGDNRDNSKDSRFWIEDFVDQNTPREEINRIVNDDKMYMVPAENIVGKAFLVWMHWPDKKLENIPSFSNDRLIK